MTDARTAQELADECIERMHVEHVKNNGWISPDRFRSIVRAVAAALASQAEPVARIAGMDEYGPMLEWSRHWTEFPIGTKLYTTPPAPAQAEQSEDGRDAARYRFAQAPADGGFCVCWWDANANRWIPCRSKAAADHHIDAAIAAKGHS